MTEEEARAIINNRQGTFARSQKEVDEYWEACRLIEKFNNNL